MAYIAAQSCFHDPTPLVFMSIRSLSMRSSVELGEIVQLQGKVDYIGESTIGVRVDGNKLQPVGEGKPVVTGTFLFCTVDEEGRALAHGLPSLADASASAQRRWKSEPLPT
jgi:acyl-CoA hydrolase